MYILRGEATRKTSEKTFFAREFVLVPKGNKKPLKGFKLGETVIKFAFLQKLCGNCVKGGIRQNN